MSVVTAIQARLGSVVRELLKFGVVGAAAFVVDVGLFNLLRYGVFTSSDKPLTAKTISVVVATFVAYLGNRHWTFRHRGRHGVARETVLFFALNAAALVMALSCLGLSHYALGLQGAVADNISANVIGLGLGTAFRFWSYRRWVFPHVEAAPVRAPVPVAAGPVRTPVRTLEPAGASRTISLRERDAVATAAAAGTTAA